ncbi:hypothetical protein [Synechococcus phage BUCT-ZZ01]|nr:hypothetical protein [Synechococcus phage BUCT-ZZ01]
MAISKSIVFNNLRRTIVKLVGDATGGTATITLAELVHVTSGFPQTVSGTPEVSIMGASLSSQDAGNATTVVRNGVPILALHACYDMPVDDVVGGIKLTEEISQDIVVTIPAGGGTLFLDLRKERGYTFGPNVA